MSKFSVKKPLTVFVAVIAILVLGVVAYFRMTPDLLPNMDFPYVLIMTTYPGASPEKVEQEITKPMEQAMSTLDHIQEVTSVSSENVGMVILEFTEGVNMDTVGVDIQQEISQLSADWSDTVGTPYVLKINPSMLPVEVAAVSMEGMDTVELTEFLDETLMNKLEGVPGVARITTSGEIEQELHVVLDQKLIDKLNDRIAAAINGELDDAAAELNEKKEELEAKEKSIEDETEINFEELAQVKGELIRLNTSLEEAQKKLDEVQVTADDLSKVIELWTGIPAHKIAETEFTKLAHLEDRLKAHIIGQDEAVESLAKAIKRTRVQLSPRRRPASFIFVGPTGVGKTELVKVLSQELFDSNDPLIRLDMTEFMEKHSVARMIGSPPGYVGYDEAGQLTEKVRRRPYSVILFDEIEKAHPDVMNILMQILDEGKIDDAQGRTVNFENTVICMTSNAGSTDKSIGVGFNRTDTEISKEKAMKGLREFLRPEFISRIDEIVVFRNLTKPDFEKIAALMLDEMKQPLAEKNITLQYDAAALAAIAEEAYGKPYGARDIRRVIRQIVEDQIASLIIAHSTEIHTLLVSAKDGKVEVTFQ